MTTNIDMRERQLSVDSDILRMKRLAYNLEPYLSEEGLKAMEGVVNNLEKLKTVVDTIYKDYMMEKGFYDDHKQHR